MRKILARRGSRESVRPGDIVTVQVDTVIFFDNNFMPANWRDVLRVRDPKRIVVVLGVTRPARAVPRELLDIVEAGGIVAFLENEGAIARKA